MTGSDSAFRTHGFQAQPLHITGKQGEQQDASKGTIGMQSLGPTVCDAPEGQGRQVGSVSAKLGDKTHQSRELQVDRDEV